MQSNLFVSTMRTLVPIVVALVLSWTGRLGIPVDSEAAASAVALGLAAAYYLAFRGLEWLAGRMAWGPLQLAAGLLLGWARPPVYDGQKTELPIRLVLDRDHLDTGMAEALAALRRATEGGKGTGG
ncbi:hypothetical protein ACKI1S_38380 [Streptomyces galilaeus]|uniref:Uncharacterized protein n=1 Tax=Streptomyces galilaeus TaxID=33899 RepID=A0ABW9IWH2_STRGJ